MSRVFVVSLALFAAAAALPDDPKPMLPKPVPTPTPADKPPPIPLGAKNLIPNGDFEEGDGSPTHWQQVDGLTSFHVIDPDPKRGKCVKFDTDVLQLQGYEWWSKIRDGAKPKDAPKKKPTVEPKYDTLAAFDGAWYWSDPISVEKGKSYWLTIDAKGPAMLAWLVGYPDEPDKSFGADAKAFMEFYRDQKLGKPSPQPRGFESMIAKYVWRGQLAIGGTERWATYSRRAQPFRPTANTPSVKWVRVLIFPFWPPGEYYVDNVRLFEVKE